MTTLEAKLRRNELGSAILAMANRLVDAERKSTQAFDRGGVDVAELRRAWRAIDRRRTALRRLVRALQDAE